MGGSVPGNDSVNGNHKDNSDIVTLEFWFVVVPEVEVYKSEGKNGIDTGEYSANEPSYPVCLTRENHQSQDVYRGASRVKYVPLTPGSVPSIRKKGST